MTTGKSGSADGRIGTSPPRPDGLPKASGVTRYADDVAFEGMWFGATVRSPHAHARVVSVAIDKSKAPGAVFVTARDLPGPNGVQLITDDWPILAATEVNHVGEAVVLAAAPSRAEARRALAAVEVTYEPLEAVLDLDEADRGEPLASYSLACGDLEAGFAAAAEVVEGTYSTGHQEHIYIECQAMTAWHEDDGTAVAVGSMQCPYYVHKALVHAFGLPEEKVRVRATPLGGGFGGKEDYPSLLAVHAALLSRAARHPVRMAYDRHEDIVATTKRHPSRIRHRTGVDAEGRLVAMDVEVLLDGGAYPTLSSVVLSRSLLHATGPYRCPNVRVVARAVRTHTVPNGAFRGFGAPQAQFASERQMDRIARRLGLDPLEIRLRNALRPGDRYATGQEMDPTTSALLCLEEVAERTDFRRRWREAENARAARADGAPLRGVGLSLYFHGAGFTGKGEDRMRSPVKVRLLPDGRMEVLTAMTEMGQGVSAVFPQIAAEAGGLAPEDFVFAEPDTANVPDSGPTVASRTTMIVGGAIAHAVAELGEQVLAWWAKREGLAGPLKTRGGEVVGAGVRFREVAAAYCRDVGPLEVTHRHKPPAWQEFDEESYRGAAYPTYAWGADVVEVEVDPDTLEVRPLKVTAVCEVGRVINKTLCAGQIEGGTVQALGWGLIEELRTEEGRYLQDRLTDYIIPTVKDVPPIEVHLLERPWEGGPFGAKGVGELPMDGGAPAAVAAVENATGLSPDHIPATPERLLACQRAMDSGLQA